MSKPRPDPNEFLQLERQLVDAIGMSPYAGYGRCGMMLGVDAMRRVVELLDAAKHVDSLRLASKSRRRARGRRRPTARKAKR